MPFAPRSGTAISLGAKAGTSGAVKRWRTSRQGVADGLALLGVSSAAVATVRLMAEETAKNRRSVLVMTREEKGCAKRPVGASYFFWGGVTRDLSAWK